MNVLLLASVPALAANVAGGKGVHLAELTAAGFPVPPGFIVITAAFGRNEPEIAAAVREAYVALGAGPVAVRSSATAEDLEGASFAGQQETYLNIEGADAVWEAVRKCWASLHGERAREYRGAQGIPDEGLAMAVVVQRMVPAAVAGVLFTQAPEDPAAMLIEAAPGLGDALVSGRVTPDRWTLASATGEVQAQAIAGAASCLTAAQLQELWRLGQRIDLHFDAPQDIEWAFDAAGALWVLQSRPITTTGADRERVRQEEIAWLRARAEPAGAVWARYSLAEVLPEPLPLTWTLWREFMSGAGGYGRLYRDLGYDPDPALDHDGVLDLIGGRPYFNLNRDCRLYFKDFPYDYPFAKLKQNPALAIYPTPEANLAKAGPGFALRLFGVTRRMLAAEKTLERAAEALPDLLERETFPQTARFVREQQALDLTALTPVELVAAFNDARATLFHDLAPVLLQASLLAGLALEKLKALLTPALGAEAAAKAAQAALAGAAPPEEYDLGGALQKLTTGSLSREEFLQRFGHRGPGEMELARPRWSELPESLPTIASSPLKSTAAASTLALPPGKRLDLRQVERLRDRARRFTGLREAGKDRFIFAYGMLRRLLLALDARTSLNGGVFYLEPDELPDLAVGTDFRATIAARRRRRALALGLEAPRVLFSDDLEALGRPLPEPETGEALSGVGVSTGAAEGPALVLHSPEAAPVGAEGFILVCPSTDPGWVPLFLRARGVVLETGGVLSHGAIVAREFGLPAVANVPDACRRLQTGQRVRIDGTSGRVWRLEGSLEQSP